MKLCKQQPMKLFKLPGATIVRSAATFCAVVGLLQTVNLTATAEVKDAAPDGFHIELRRELDVEQAEAFRRFVEEFPDWYDAEHSYGGKAENLSMNLDQRCMLEKLDQGGFVRHMEIVYCQPGHKLRLTGGLGPLQEMGVHGAMTYSFSQTLNSTDSGQASDRSSTNSQADDNDSAATNAKSEVILTYVVSGFSKQELDKLAPIVDKVLAGQMDRFQKHCRATK